MQRICYAKDMGYLALSMRRLLGKSDTVLQCGWLFQEKFEKIAACAQIISEQMDMAAEAAVLANVYIS